MSRKLSTKIGIIGVLLILIIVLSTVMVNAQPPTVTVTASPVPTNAPAITSFTVNVAKAGNNSSTPPTAADVKISVNLINANLSTSTSSGNGGPAPGLLEFCYDVETVPTQLGTLTPNAPSAIPTVTDSSVAALPGNCLLTTQKTITLQNVSVGEHTFGVELVNSDGSSMNPRVHFDLKMNVFLPE
jgi:hypothetical protein